MKELGIHKYIKPKIPITLTQQSKKWLSSLESELRSIYNALGTQSATQSVEESSMVSYVKGELFTSIPPEIQNIIKNAGKKTSTKCFKWSIVGYNVSLYINYANEGSTTGNNIKKASMRSLHEYYILIRTIIEFLAHHNDTNSGKTRNISVYLYLTKHIKLPPKNADKTLGWINVNTGVTVGCGQHTEINVFRVEEWFKVFIHECIHNFCMDFNNIMGDSAHKKMRTTFIIDSDYLLFETYTELWAEIIQMLFINNMRGGDNMAELITNEFCFSLLQAKKSWSICTQGRATYQDLVNGDETVLQYYKEESNCFSYYILRMVALYKINDFLSWCHRNNGGRMIAFSKSEENIMRFIDFFIERYKDAELVRYIEEDTSSGDGGAFINKTIRISIYEIVV
jgi:hypothetical protein